MHERELEGWFGEWRRGGDLEALGKVFDAAAPELLRVAMSLVRDPAEAEDLVQATFLTAIERAERYDAERALVPWLVGILVRHAHELRRQRSRGVPVEAARSDSPPDPAEVVGGSELAEALEKALATLPELYRTVLVPFLEEGKKAVEIGRELGRAPGTVRMQLHRGLEHLRRALPAGLATGALVALGGGRGLAVVRAAVLEAGRSSVLVGASGGAGLGSWIGGTALMKKVGLGTLALFVAGGLLWMARTPLAEPASGVSFEAEDVATAGERTELESAGVAGEEAAREEVSEDGARRAVAAGGVEGEVAEGGDGALSGRVLLPDGEPYAGVAVWLLALDPSEVLASVPEWFEGEPPRFDFAVGRTTTDAEGRFRLSGGRTGALHGLGIDLEGERPTLLAVEHPLGHGLVSVGDLRLQPTGSVRGRVAGAGGRPLAGARVRAAALPRELLLFGLADLREDGALLLTPGGEPLILELPEYLRVWLRRLPVPATSTDARGEFVLHGVPTGPAQLVVDHPGYVSESRGLEIAPSSDVELETLALETGRELRGRVVDALGQPMAGVEVRVGAGPLGGGMASSPVLVLQDAGLTDGAGGFRIAGMQRGFGVQVALRRDPSHAWHLVRGFEHRDEDEFSLPGGASLRVLARDEAGRPVPGAEVLLSPQDRTEDTFLVPFLPHLALEERTDAEGTLLLADLAPGTYRLHARAPGRALASLPVRLSAGETLAELVLAPSARHRVRVIDAETEEPVAGAHVSFLHEDPRRASPAVARTGANGEARLAGFDPAAAQVGKIRIAHSGYATTHRDLLPGDVQVVRLDRGGSLKVQVSYGAAPPPPGLLFVLESVHSEFPDSGFARLATLDAEGSARLEALTPGQYHYALYDDRAPSVEARVLGQVQAKRLVEEMVWIARGEEAQLVLDLGRGGRSSSVAGRVFLDGEPAAGLIVSAGEPMRPEAGTYAVHAQVETDASGSFDLGELPPGRSDLTISERGGAMRTTLYQEELLLQPGEGRFLEFDWTRYTVEARVERDSDAAPVEGAWVQLVPSGPGRGLSVPSALSDAEGRVRLESLHTGAFVLRASHGVEGHAEERLELQPGVSIEGLRLALDRGVPCAGEVRLASAPNGLDGTLILSEVDGERTLYASLRFDRGRSHFEAVGLRPGRLRAAVFAGDAVSRAVVVELPSGGSEALTIEVELERDPLPPPPGKGAVIQAVIPD